ncbi:hypothetical protein [Halorhabdus amylolytica]|uniref:hypothetical protein n=1 Tax=Halorhabdus amylolytica TaxID=2559573 RepID=UPI0010AB083E|nr:hypothetical protein [Halorhabdus amylolytica]
MDILSWVRELPQGIGWKEIFIGFLISILLSPIFSMLVTPVYVSVGVYSTPQIDASVEKVDPEYPSGAKIERFDNLTWEPDYSVYRTRFTHESGPILSRAVFEVRFPGCVKQAEVPSSQGSGSITINAPLNPRIEALERPDSEVLGCTSQIVTENIHNHEGYTVEFVVEHNFSRCDVLSAYNPNKRFFIDQTWRQNGQKMEERHVGEIKNANEEFRNIGLPSNSTKLVQKEDYSAYLFGIGNGDKNAAMNQCFGT